MGEKRRTGLMEIARLRALCELSRRKTMAAVAEALHISASAISQQISQLEDEAGIRLIERRGRGVQLTEAGERLAAYSEKIVGMLSEAKADLAELKNVVAGELRLAAFPSIASTVVPLAMRDLRVAHPKLRIVLNTMEPMEGIAALRAWQTDMAIIDDMTIDPSGLDGMEKIALCDDLLYLILPADHRLAGRSRVDLAELSDASWAIDVAENRYSEVIVRACQAAGFNPAVNGFCSSSGVIIALVEAGCAVSIMPGLYVRKYRGNVAVKPIFPEMRRRISVAVRRGETRNPSIVSLLEALRGATSHLGLIAAATGR